MVTTVVPFLALVLLIVPSYTHVPSSYYYIYSLNVDIPTYYCFYQNNYVCSTFRNSRPVKNVNQSIRNSCRSTNSQKGIEFLYNVITFGNLEVTICEIPSPANLLEGTVTLSKDQMCKFENRNCFDKKAWKFVNWIYDNTSKSLTEVYKGNFDECTSNNQKYIYNDKMSLLLTKQVSLYNKLVWKTDYSGILVSKNAIRRNSANISYDFQSTLPEDCKPASMTKKSVPNTGPQPIKWYIYEYPVNITVIYCAIQNDTISCENIQSFKTEKNPALLEKCKDKFCDSSCPSKRNIITVCSKIQQIDFEKNTIMGLPLECKYSHGFCNTTRAFWEYNDRCMDIQKTHEGEEKHHVHNTQSTIVLENSEILSITHYGKICTYNVWFTYKNGQFASREELNLPDKNEFHPTISSKNADMLRSVNNDSREEEEEENVEAEKEEEPKQLGFNNQIIDLQTKLYCLMLFVVICFVFYIFNVIVNYLTLRKFGRRGKVKDRPCCLSCLSQSLTTRYISLKQVELNDAGTNKIYETVENELYNK